MQVKVNYLSTFNSNETVQPTLESKKEVLPIIIVFNKCLNQPKRQSYSAIFHKG